MQTIYKRSFKLTLIFIVFYFLLACSAISPQVVELSTSVSEQIKALRENHVESANAYYDYQLIEIDRFMEQEWVPLFLRNFIGISGVMNDIDRRYVLSGRTKKSLSLAVELYLDDPGEAEAFVSDLESRLAEDWGATEENVSETVSSYVDAGLEAQARSHILALLGTADRAEIMLDFAEAANAKIQKQYRALTVPIESARKEELSAVNAMYDDLLRAQGIVTGRLEAEMKKDSATRLMFGSLIGEDRSDSILNATRTLADKAQEVRETLPDLQEKFAELKAKINE